MIWQDTLSPLARLYRYDALNRLKEQKPFLVNHNLFTPIQSWATNYAYDKMGNILSLNRNATAEMDRMKYFYYPQSNKLSYITDSVTSSSYPNDIDNQNPNNYTYNLIGNLTEDKSEKLKITWSHYGKVKQIDSILTSTTTQPKLKFRYDALGNRLIKENVKTKTKEVYLRDAQGNLIALYQIKNDSLFAKEFYMYGSSRLGYTDENIFLAKKSKISNFPLSNFSTLKYSNQVPRNVNYTFGKKQYEINDWLGNVRAVISDKKIPEVSGNVVTGYKAQVLSVSDYYPFGMSIAERSYEKKNYRYGFQRQESENDLYGSGNASFFKYRISDNRLGRFFSVDPLASKYPWNSPYTFSANRVIDAIELEGAEYVIRKHYIDRKTQLEVERTDEIFYQSQTSGYYAAPFGPEGRGVKHEYYDLEGKQYGDPRWDLQQGNWLSSGSIGSHLLYSGPGSISYTGYEDYDFSWNPQDRVDKISKKHDIYYASIKDRYIGFLEDTRTLEYDKIMIKELDEFIFSTGFLKSAGETQDAAIKARLYISTLAGYKEWKKNKLTSKGLDPYNPDNIKKITIDNYVNLWSAGIRWTKYAILKASEPEKKKNEKREWKSLEEQETNK